MRKKLQLQIEKQIKLERQKVFEKFIAGLTKLSKKHGVLLQVTGGVKITDNTGLLENLTYSRDASSGDVTYEL